MPSKEALRSSFDESPDLYDKARPGYPRLLVEDIISLAQIPDGGSILEVGCGTGQATVPFAGRGYEMLCLDIGKGMAEFAAAKLRRHEAVTVTTTSFEDWIPKPRSFDLVISATAFHWIPAEIAYPKSALVLKDSGSLAVFRNYHLVPAQGFFREVQAVYKECAPDLYHPPAPGDPDGKKKTEADIGSVRNDFEASGVFAEVEVRRYPWLEKYDPDQYITLLNTYSDHIKLQEDRRKALFEGIKYLIRRKFSRVTKEYLAVLWFARKR